MAAGRAQGAAAAASVAAADAGAAAGAAAGDGDEGWNSRRHAVRPRCDRAAAGDSLSHASKFSRNSAAGGMAAVSQVSASPAQEHGGDAGDP